MGNLPPLAKRWLPVFFTVTGTVRDCPGDTDKLDTEEVICWLKLVRASLTPFGSAGACELDCWPCGEDLHAVEIAKESTTAKTQSAEAAAPIIGARGHRPCSNVPALVIIRIVDHLV